MNKNSIKFKLLSLIFLSTLISFVILGFNNAQNSYSSQHKLVKENSLNVTKETSKYINSYLQSKIDIISAITEVMPIDDSFNINNEDIQKTLKLGAQAGGFDMLYIGVQENGNFLASTGKKRTPQTTDYDSRKRDWYTQALKDNKAGITSPYVDFDSKKLVVSVFAPLKNNNKIIGVVSSDIFIDTIVNTILKVKIEGGEGIAYLIDENAKIIIHKNKKLFNKKDSLFAQIKENDKDSLGEALDNGIEKIIAYSTIETTGWKLILELDKASYFKEIDNAIIEEVIIYILLLLIILSIIYYALSKIIAPIKKVEEGFSYFFRYLKNEEENIKIIDINTNDEFGNMAKVINVEMQTIAKNINEDRELIENVKSVVSHVKNGKLDMQIEKETSNKSLNELKNNINEMIKTINKNVNSDINPILFHLEEYAKLDFRNSIPNPDGNISKGLNNLSDIINKMLQENKQNGITLSDNSKTLLSNVDILNRSSNETAVSLEETSAALEEITSTVVSNTNRISDMSEHSNALTLAIKQGQDLANSTVISMDEINEQTQSIAAAITVIDQIAFQTNILSLNAAVEAATAGESGKGFAVVAQEVRNLASRSADAAKEIKDLVENATKKTDNGKSIADKMIQGYEVLNQNIEKTASIIQDIKESSAEQRTGIEQINDVVNRLDQQTQKNASVATQTHSIAMQTANIAEDILNAVNEKKFKEQ